MGDSCGYPVTCNPPGPYGPTPPVDYPTTTTTTTTVAAAPPTAHGLPVTGGDVLTLGLTGSLVLFVGCVLTLRSKKVR